jgi:hypothetical protein
MKPFDSDLIGALTFGGGGGRADEEWKLSKRPTRKQVKVEATSTATAAASTAGAAGAAGDQQSAGAAGKEHKSKTKSSRKSKAVVADPEESPEPEVADDSLVSAPCGVSQYPPVPLLSLWSDQNLSDFVM